MPDRSPLLHLFAGAFVAAMLGLAVLEPDVYRGLVQEDRLIEWATVGLFLGAAAVRFHAAVRTRRGFDALVGLFCLFVAGEEISWGQRLLGLTPPDYFLEQNFQQEANLHNFAAVFGKPKWILAMTLAGYGLLLPALARSARGRSLLERLRATSPDPRYAPWFGLAVLLLIVYPVSFTGEWVEALAAFLFLASAPLPESRLWLVAGASAAAAAVFALVSARAADPGGLRTACAASEAEALVRDLATGDVALPKLAAATSVHKRVYTAAQEDYLQLTAATGFAVAACEDGGRDVATRRRYAVDPWGMAYWVVARVAEDGARTLAIHSMGPNRRRDGDPLDAAGDDVTVLVELPPPAVASAENREEMP